jgi:hypothetical protein
MSKNTIKTFLEYYFKNRQLQYSESEVKDLKFLQSTGILKYINDDTLQIVSESIELQETLFDISSNILERELPEDVFKAFSFIDKLDEKLRKKYKYDKLINAYSPLLNNFRGYVLYKLHKKGVDVKKAVTSLSFEKRKGNLYSLERSFFKYIHLYNFSNKEYFDLFNLAYKDDNKKHDVLDALRNLPKKDNELSISLLNYAKLNNEPLVFLSELLVGLYNIGKTDYINDIIEIKKQNENVASIALSNLKYKDSHDIKIVFKFIENIDYEKVEITGYQTKLITKIIKSEHTDKQTRELCFKLLKLIMESGTESVVSTVFNEINFLEGFEIEKYKLLHVYLDITGNVNVIKSYFYRFEDPEYIFDLLIKVFLKKPTFLFPLNLFEEGLNHVWNINELRTKKKILSLFEHPTLSILGVKILLAKHLGIFKVDFLKLKKAEFQINAINSICKCPHSFDELILLILPLRDSTLNDVREHLQFKIAQKVFLTYQDTIYDLVKKEITSSDKDQEFFILIEKALNDYYKLKELKESINDLNPLQNEKKLVDFYYRLEKEMTARMMAKSNDNSIWTNVFKKSIIVRGNSFKYDGADPIPLSKIETSITLDGNMYLNPDLYEYNLNLIE